MNNEQQTNKITQANDILLCQQLEEIITPNSNSHSECSRLMDFSKGMEASLSGEPGGLQTQQKHSGERPLTSQPFSDYEFLPAKSPLKPPPQQEFRINHECSCVEEEECGEGLCSCYLTPRQICVIGQCCPRCISYKNQFLQHDRGWTLSQNKQKQPDRNAERINKLMREKNCTNLHYFKQIKPNDTYLRNLIFCNCKKTHCQKNYCLCYSKGVLCGQFCCCSDCHNKEEGDELQKEEQMLWEKYAVQPMHQDEDKDRIDMDIEQFIEEEALGAAEVPAQMEFDPPNFQDRPSMESY